MAHEDFSLESLADYLHLQHGQVARLVERRQLPGRRVAGEWRFSRAEIHHWLEARMGALDDAELARLEGAMHRAAPAAAEPIELTQLIPLTAIGVPLAARTKAAVVDALVELATSTGRVWDPTRIAEAVRQREELHSTALDNGVALLHPRRPLADALEQPVIALGRSSQGLPFGAVGGGLTDLFFLICSTDDAGHLQVLARLGRLLGNSQLLSALRDADNAMTLRETLLLADRQI